MRWLVVFFAFAILSCGARKVNRNDIVENVDAHQNNAAYLNLKKDIETSENCSDSTTTIKTTYSPIDPTKPASVKDKAGKTHNLNNASETIEETKSKSSLNLNTKTNIDSNINSKSDDSIIAKSDQSTEQIDKGAVSFWWVLIPLIIVLVALLLFLRYFHVDQVSGIIGEIWKFAQSLLVKKNI